MANNCNLCYAKIPNKFNLCTSCEKKHGNKKQMANHNNCTSCGKRIKPIFNMCFLCYKKNTANSALKRRPKRVRLTEEQVQAELQRQAALDKEWEKASQNKPLRNFQKKRPPSS